MVALKDKRVIDWRPIRCAYIERQDKPTYQELSEEFHVALSSVCNTAADEGWVLQRTKFFQSVAVQGDVTQGLIELARERSETGSTLTNLMLVSLKEMTAVVSSFPPDMKPRARADIITSGSFAAMNFARALKDAGLASVPKELTDELTKGEHSSEAKNFLKQALQQINVSVQVQAPQAQPLAKKAEPVTELPPT